MWVCISSHCFPSHDHNQGLKGPAFSSMLQESVFHSFLLERNYPFVFPEFPFLMKIAWLASHSCHLECFSYLSSINIKSNLGPCVLLLYCLTECHFIPSSRIFLRFWHLIISKNLLMEDDHLEFAVQNQLKLQALTWNSAWIFGFFFSSVSLYVKRKKKSCSLFWNTVPRAHKNISSLA